MVITTAYKEYKHDEEFGSEIWECDFDVLSNINNLKEKIKISLIEKISKFEKRLNNTKVVVILGETYIPDINQTRLKKQLIIKISGNLKKTNEPFSFEGRYFIAPLSYQEY